MGCVEVHSFSPTDDGTNPSGGRVSFALSFRGRAVDGLEARQTVDCAVFLPSRRHPRLEFGEPVLDEVDLRGAVESVLFVSKSAPSP